MSSLGGQKKCSLNWLSCQKYHSIHCSWCIFKVLLQSTSTYALCIKTLITFVHCTSKLCTKIFYKAIFESFLISKMFLFSEFLQSLASVTAEEQSPEQQLSEQQSPDQQLSELYRQELPVQLKSIRVESRNWVASSFR